MNTSETTGLVLAGGAGRRAGGVDKGLVQWQGLPLIEHVTSRLALQVGHLIISCNRNAGEYAKYAPRVVTDQRPGHQGPLAGIEAATPLVETPLLVVIACDVPRLPRDLVQRLSNTLRDHPEAGAAYAVSGGRSHYLCAMLRTESLPSLSAFLDEGGRAVGHWYHHLGAMGVTYTDQESAFVNINNPCDD